MDDYTKDELAEIVHEIEKYEKGQLEESDIEAGEGLDGEEEEQSDPEDNVPLSYAANNMAASRTSDSARVYGGDRAN